MNPERQRPERQRIAVVTGASSGIGKEVAKALAGAGWRVIGTGRDPARIAATQAELRALSPTGSAAMLHADLSLMAGAARLAEEIAARTDRIDLLVNNAGGMPRNPLADDGKVVERFWDESEKLVARAEA